MYLLMCFFVCLRMCLNVLHLLHPFFSVYKLPFCTEICFGYHKLCYDKSKNVTQYLSLY